MAERLIAVGDIHGCYHSMVNLLREIEYSSQNDTLVFIGDYIDRGPNSYEVVTQLKKLQEQVGSDKVICLRGNHEQMAIDAYEKGQFPTWEMNGGMYTVESFANNGETVETYISWFKSLPLVYDTPEIIFCHAGLSYPELKDNTEDDLLWGRNWIFSDLRPREKQVIFGHTPKCLGKAYTAANGIDICIDAGCVFGGHGRLCALVFNEDGTSKTFYVDKSRKDWGM